MITINIDLGSAKEVKALILFDHNLSSTATITLKGVDPTILSEAVTWVSGKITHYLAAATTKRYWQLQITDASNSDTYIKIGELFLGSYFEPAKNFSYGTGVRGIKSIISREITSYGISNRRFYNFQKQFSYDLNYITDIADFVTMLEALADKDTGIIKPLYFNEDSVTPANTWMVELEELPYKLPHNTLRTTQLIMMEKLKSV